jgi:hypothetical protein
VKLRIQGNSIRLRVSRPDLARLLSFGRIEDIVHFGEEENACLKYVLEHSANVAKIAVRHVGTEVAIILPSHAAQSWAESDQVGIYAKHPLGKFGELAVIVEKDFPCGNPADPENADKFPRPDSGVC